MSTIIPVEFSLMSSESEAELGLRRLNTTSGNKLLFPLHEASFLGNLFEVQNLLEKENDAIISSNKKSIFSLNSHHRTPLHECARGDGGSQSIKIAHALLSHVAADRLESYLKKVDENRCTALYYAVNNSNLPLVELLLEKEYLATLSNQENQEVNDEDEAGAEAAAGGRLTTDENRRVSVIRRDGRESLLFLATTNGSLSIIKVLLKYGYTVGHLEHGKLLGETVLKKNSAPHLEIFKFFLESLIQSEMLDELHELDEKLKYIVHFAAKNCNLEILQVIANHPVAGDDFPFLRRRKNLTPIHYVLKSWADDKFFDCIRLLIKKCFETYDGFVLYDELYSSKDSALNFAFGEIRLHGAPTYIVEALVENIPTQNAECWEKFRTNEELLNKLYERTPSVLPKLLNKCASLVNVENVHIDFGCIIPIEKEVKKKHTDSHHHPSNNHPTTRIRSIRSSPSSTCSKQEPETRYLVQILRKEPSIQKAILLHPVVKIYLDLKYKSFYAFNLFCCFIQIIFLACYTYLIPSQYSSDDEDENNSTADTDTEHDKFYQDLNDQNPPGLFGLEGISPHITILILTIILTYIIPNIVKEIWQISKYRFSFILSPINIVQLLNLICVTLICVECLLGDSTLYPLAALSGLLSWILFLRELSKIFTECNIWTSALLKVISRSIKLAIYFLPLLIGFYLVFQVLIPWRNFNYWLGGIGRMLILMTGEFEYDETFNKEESKISEMKLFLGTSSFLLFVIVIVISLSNLLVAVAVEDIAKLRRDSEFKSLAGRLENIYNLETVYSTLSQFSCLRGFLYSVDKMCKKVSKIIMKVCEFCCAADETRKVTISRLSLEIPKDGKISIPRNAFTEQQLKELKILTD